MNQSEGGQGKWTPGPWRAQERLSGSENHKGWLIFGALKGVVGEVYPLNGDPTPAARANAALIASAPQLYAALLAVVELSSVTQRGTFKFDEAVAAARSALASARGEGER